MDQSISIDVNHNYYSKGSLISITNWNYYQMSGPADGPHVESDMNLIRTGYESDMNRYNTDKTVVRKEKTEERRGKETPHSAVVSSFIQRKPNPYWKVWELVYFSKQGHPPANSKSEHTALASIQTLYSLDEFKIAVDNLFGYWKKERSLAFLFKNWVELFNLANEKKETSVFGVHANVIRDQMKRLNVIS